MINQVNYQASKASAHKIDFNRICEAVQQVMENEWKNTDEAGKERKLQREKRAIIGYEKETEFYKEKIREILRERGLLDGDFPKWYSSLEEGVFAELYGLAGLTPWAYDHTEEYKKSSSAKLIGERLYCLIDGKSVLQPQKITLKRRQQLKRALLLATPRERLEAGFHEVYLHNGIRITIYSGERTKYDQDVMVFRKYTLKNLSFEGLVSCGTIPAEAVELFKLMVKIGFNVMFSGQVRSGKTTFLQTWQKYEDTSLEGLVIATDPETPWHEIMPDAPIMQLIADDKELENITKSLLRGDNDYVLLEEMRDAVAFSLALDITSTGTMRSKATIHSSDAVNIPYQMASKIKTRYGGDLPSIILQVFRNFNYVFEFSQMTGDRSVKKLMSLNEYCYDPHQDRVSVHRICEYDLATDNWHWNYHMGKDKEKFMDLWPEEVNEMKKIVNELELKSPITKNTVIYPRYYHPNMKIKGGGND